MRNKELRIGVFTHNYPANSLERKDAGMFVHDFCHELARSSDVFVFCPDFGGKKEKYKKAPVTWMDWGGPKKKFGTWSFFSPISVFNFFKLIIVGCREAENFAIKNKINYCLACWTLPASIYTLWLNIKLGIPYGVWILGSDVNIYAKFPILRQLTIMALNRAQTRFANSYWFINIVEKLVGKKCVYMDAITEFEVNNVKKRKLNSKTFNFLYAGSIRKVKGVDILVRAVDNLQSKKTNFHVHILGDGPIKKNVERFVKKNNLTNFITFYGVVSKETVAAFMKSADTLIVSSRAESIPLVIVEAARAGLPTISSDVGDDRRVIEKYRIGLVCKNNDPQDMARVMLRAMKEGSKFKKTRQKGLIKLSKDRSQKVAVSTLLSTIKI